MLPLAAEPCSGTSSLAISARRLDIRAGFGLRTISELLRTSTRIDGAASVAAPPAPGTAMPPVGESVNRWIIGAMSEATA